MMWERGATLAEFTSLPSVAFGLVLLTAFAVAMSVVRVLDISKSKRPDVEPEEIFLYPTTTGS